MIWVKSPGSKLRIKTLNLCNNFEYTRIEVKIVQSLNMKLGFISKIELIPVDRKYTDRGINNDAKCERHTTVKAQN